MKAIPKPRTFEVKQLTADISAEDFNNLVAWCHGKGFFDSHAPSILLSSNFRNSPIAMPGDFIVEVAPNTFKRYLPKDFYEEFELL